MTLVSDCYGAWRVSQKGPKADGRLEPIISRHRSRLERYVLALATPELHITPPVLVLPLGTAFFPATQALAWPM